MRLTIVAIGVILCSMVFLLVVDEVKEDCIKPRIAFAVEHGEGLYVLDDISGKLLNVDNETPEIHDITSCGQLIAFTGSCYHEGPSSLYIYNINTGEKEHINGPKKNGNSFFRIQFDSKGSYLYAVYNSEGVYRYSLSTRTWEQVRVIGADKLHLQDLALSKSGRKVAIISGRYDCVLIADVNSDCNEFVVQDEILNEFDSCISPQWIGDESLIFLGRKESGSQHIWKLDLLSERITQITKEEINCRDFMSVSRDERDIVFTGTNQHKWRLWQISIDESGLKQLTKDSEQSGHLFPVWLE